MYKISSLQNGRVKEVIRLRERREREKSDLFLIEGYRELKRAIDANRTISTIFYCPSLFLGDGEQELLTRTNAEMLSCSPEVFQKISYRDRPDGLLAVAPQLHLRLQNLHLSAMPFLVIAESIEKPGNLGTILRSSDAVGADAVIVCDPTTDIHNPNVVRSSVGTLFTIPTLEVSGEEALAFLRKNKIAIVATTPHTDKLYCEENFEGPVAIVVGTEQYGLSETWLKEADYRVRIPMRGVADSLNVASATTLLLYEVIRQRRLLR